MDDQQRLRCAKGKSLFSRYRHVYIGGNMPSLWDPGWKKHKIKTKKTTLAKLALYASGFVVDASFHKSLHF